MSWFGNLFGKQEKTIQQSVDNPKVAFVTSKPGIKTEAAETALSSVGAKDITVIGVGTDSGVSEQPYSKKQTKAGAEGRLDSLHTILGYLKSGKTPKDPAMAKLVKTAGEQITAQLKGTNITMQQALEGKNNALNFSFENGMLTAAEAKKLGIDPKNSKHVDTCIIVIEDRDGNRITGHDAGLRVDPKFSKYVDQARIKNSRLPEDQRANGTTATKQMIIGGVISAELAQDPHKEFGDGPRADYLAKGAEKTLKKGGLAYIQSDNEEPELDSTANLPRNSNPQNRGGNTKRTR